MICDAVLERLDALLDGSLTGSDRAAVLRHFDDCAECRELCAALAAAGDAPENPGLAESILARTTGSACGTARARLCAWVDGELDTFDAELVRGHLRTCSECEGLARALERLPEELPRLAAIDPGPSFVEAVLSRTSRRPRRVPLRERLASAVAQLLDRPRVAWEGAFVATAVLAVLFLAPGTPFADVPRVGLELVRHPAAEQRLALGELRGTVKDLEATLAVGARSAWGSFARGSTDTWETIRRGLGTFPGSAASGQVGDGAGTNDRAPDAAQENEP